jgi:hypothetical protein
LRRRSGHRWSAAARPRPKVLHSEASRCARGRRAASAAQAEAQRGPQASTGTGARHARHRARARAARAACEERGGALKPSGKKTENVLNVPQSSTCIGIDAAHPIATSCHLYSCVSRVSGGFGLRLVFTLQLRNRGTAARPPRPRGLPPAYALSIRSAFALKRLCYRPLW